MWPHPPLPLHRRTAAPLPGHSPCRRTSRPPTTCISSSSSRPGGDTMSQLLLMRRCWQQLQRPRAMAPPSPTPRLGALLRMKMMGTSITIIPPFVLRAVFKPLVLCAASRLSRYAAHPFVCCPARHFGCCSAHHFVRCPAHCFVRCPEHHVVRCPAHHFVCSPALPSTTCACACACVWACGGGVLAGLAGHLGPRGPVRASWAS